MPYNTRKLTKDSNQDPVPQYFNKFSDQYEAIEGRYGSNSFLQKGTVAEESWEGTGDIIKPFPSERFGFSIINDGTADLTFTINGNTRKVKPGEGYNALFHPFTSVVIKATSAYRAEVLS